MKFKIYCDPSHSWVKVPISLINKLNIQRKISNYSYVKGEFVYLEEDCDLKWFAQAMEEDGKSIEFQEIHSNRMSRIRSYSKYKHIFGELS